MAALPEIAEDAVMTEAPAVTEHGDRAHTPVPPTDGAKGGQQGGGSGGGGKKKKKGKK